MLLSPDSYAATWALRVSEALPSQFQSLQSQCDCLAWVRHTFLDSAIPNGSGHEIAKPQLAFQQMFSLNLSLAVLCILDTLPPLTCKPTL